MTAAISSIHDDPAHGWTLQEQAERAGMSRSTFALKFKKTVGDSPMEYLTRWRMLLAGDKRANSSDPVSAIAPSLGYESGSAFSTASGKSWAVRHANTAVAEIRLPLPMARGKTRAPTISNSSAVDWGRVGQRYRKAAALNEWVGHLPEPDCGKAERYPGAIRKVAVISVRLPDRRESARLCRFERTQPGGRQPIDPRREYGPV